MPRISKQRRAAVLRKINKKIAKKNSKPPPDPLEWAISNPWNSAEEIYNMSARLEHSLTEDDTMRHPQGKYSMVPCITEPVFGRIDDLELPQEDPNSTIEFPEGGNAPPDRSFDFEVPRDGPPLKPAPTVNTYVFMSDQGEPSSDDVAGLAGVSFGWELPEEDGPNSFTVDLPERGNATPDKLTFGYEVPRDGPPLELVPTDQGEPSSDDVAGLAGVSFGWELPPEECPNSTPNPSTVDLPERGNAPPDKLTFGYEVPRDGPSLKPAPAVTTCFVQKAKTIVLSISKTRIVEIQKELKGKDIHHSPNKRSHDEAQTAMHVCDAIKCILVYGKDSSKFIAHEIDKVEN